MDWIASIRGAQAAYSAAFHGASLGLRGRTAAATASAILVCAIGCGGKTMDDGSADDADVPGAPPPTCNAICRHVVDSCFPDGVIEPCASACEKMVADYTGCPALDPFLRCNAKARIKCSDMAVIDDCYAERNELARCKSK